MTTSNSILKIVLRGQEFLLKPLNLGQLERVAEINETLPRDVTKLSEMNLSTSIRHSRRVLSVALERDYPELAKDDCAEAPGALEEVVLAAQDILVHSGLMQRQRDAGEAKPVAEPSVTEPSAPGLQQPAAGSPETLTS